MTLPIITKRLILRRFSDDDAQDLLEFVSHPSVARVTPEIGTTEDKVRAYIDLQSSYQPFERDKCFDLALERKSDGKVLGLLSLICRNHNKAEIGWGLGVAHRGQGFATEGARALMAYGFSNLGLHRIQATTSSVNTGSWQLMERLGMRREACLREAEFRDGEWLDVLIYGLLAREWQAMAAFQGLIFDLNGVLWWDNHLQEQAWRLFSAQMRGEPFSDEEMAIHIHGRTNRHTLEYLTGRALAASEVERLSEQKETLYRQLCLDQGPAFALSPGASELLDYLDARGIARTIATASGKANLDFFVEHLHLDRWFDVALIVYDDGTRPGKPAPDIYLQAAANLALAPGQCVVVEDSLSGIQAAYAASIGYIVALGPVESHDRLAQLAGVDAVVSSLRQFPRERLCAQRTP